LGRKKACRRSIKAPWYLETKKKKKKKKKKTQWQTVLKGNSEGRVANCEAVLLWQWPSGEKHAYPGSMKESLKKAQ